MASYKTISGDTWDQISFKTFGSEKYTKELVEANLEYVSTVIFSAGIELKIPNIIENISTSLPPWKQGVINANS